MSTIEEKLMGSASATLNGLRIVGGFIGIGIFSYLSGKYLGDRDIEPSVFDELMQVLHEFYVIALVLAILSLSLLVLGVVSRRRAEAKQLTQ